MCSVWNTSVTSAGHFLIRAAAIMSAPPVALLEAVMQHSGFSSVSPAEETRVSSAFTSSVLSRDSEMFTPPALINCPFFKGSVCVRSDAALPLICKYLIWS